MPKYRVSGDFLFSFWARTLICEAALYLAASLTDYCLPPPIRIELIPFFFGDFFARVSPIMLSSVTEMCLLPLKTSWATPRSADEGWDYATT